MKGEKSMVQGGKEVDGGEKKDAPRGSVRRQLGRVSMCLQGMCWRSKRKSWHLQRYMPHLHKQCRLSIKIVRKKRYTRPEEYKGAGGKL
jgi:hypothetical protein